MSDPRGDEAPDLAALARRFLDQWQDQMAALAGDTETAEQLRRIMLGLGLAAASGPALWAGPPAGGEARSGDVVRGDGAQAAREAAGSAAATLSPGGGGGDLAQLARRLADAERRIAELEAAAARRGGAARRKPRRRRS